jgi:hypothetical protein
MRSILIDHARRYPEWAVDDLYKLIHQAAMGSKHALTDESVARESLLQELAHLDRGPDEPLVDPISPDGRVVRVHLRPFSMLRLRQESLLLAFIRTPKEVPPSVDSFGGYAAAAAQLAQEGRLAFTDSRLAAYLSEMQASGFPAVHHSQGYARLYRPAYRVVAWDLLPEEIMAAAQQNLDDGSDDGRRR